MSAHFNDMPIDRSQIKTRAKFHRELLSDPKNFIVEHDLPVRSAKPSRGCRNGCPIRTITLDVQTYKGIKIEISSIAGEPLSHASIDFNPGVLLFGANGRIITLNEFLDALAILVALLKPLLADPNDWPCLIPGLRRGCKAFWSYLEVFIHLVDTDGSLLAGFRNMRHPRLKTPYREWSDSILAGRKRSNLFLSIYRKAVEMHAVGKLTDAGLATYGSVIRFEARMKEDKLVHYFDNGNNVEVIDGVKRLLHFFPADLIRGHRMAFLELHGVHALDSKIAQALKPKPLEARGRLLVDLAADPRVPFTFHELLQRVIDYTGVDRSSTTITAMRQAGELELERRSIITRDLFSELAYRTQCSVRSREFEEKVRHEIRTLIPDRLILDTYRPSDQPHDYISDFPTYIKP